MILCHTYSCIPLLQTRYWSGSKYVLSIMLISGIILNQKDSTIAWMPFSPYGIRGKD